MTDRTVILTPTEALNLVLDHVDYTEGACDATEMVAAAVPLEVIEQCRTTLRLERGKTARLNAAAGVNFTE